MLRPAGFVLFAVLTTHLTLAQDAGPHPPPYRGVTTLVGGVFVTPVPGTPFSAVVQIESTQFLPDGTSARRKSIANIARDSQGRIYNERRAFLPSSVTGTPEVLSSHIFDPETRLSTFLNPFSHLARQQTLPERPAEAPTAAPASRLTTDGTGNPFFKQEDLGTDTMENLTVHGMRETRTIPAAVTGTGKNMVVISEYWYSDELHMNMLTKHNDPRTGIQVVTITQVNRSEPEPALFQVPQGYKIVDENPPNE
jgi:hypothetical protein